MVALLTGNEVLQILSQDSTGRPAATTEQVTTQQIANLALIGFDTVPVTNTSIATVGNGVLTAAAMNGGYITRTGSVAAFTDTTDTAAAIIAGIPNAITGQAYVLTIKNNTAFPETIAGGTGVTLSGGTVIPGLSSGFYLVTITGATTISMFLFTINSNITVSQNTVTALTTVGAGTITAAGIVGGITNRGGTQTVAFTDTTDTAAAIIAAIPDVNIGATLVHTYQNNTAWPVTITGGTGNTVSGITVVPANSWARYLVTYTAAGTTTMYGYEQGYYQHTGTFINNGVTGVTTADASFTANSNVIISLKTIGGTVGAIPHLATVTPGTGFTTVGTASDTSTYTYTILG